MAPPGTVPMTTRMIPLCASADRMGGAGSAAKESASQTMPRRFIEESFFACKVATGRINSPTGARTTKLACSADEKICLQIRNGDRDAKECDRKTVQRFHEYLSRSIHGEGLARQKGCSARISVWTGKNWEPVRPKKRRTVMRITDAVPRLRYPSYSLGRREMRHDMEFG